MMLQLGRSEPPFDAEARRGEKCVNRASNARLWLILLNRAQGKAVSF